MVYALLGLLPFVVAVVIAIRSPSSVKGRPRDLAGHSAIKGLLPFELGDAELFVRLQREPIVRDCTQAIIDSNFRIGFLCGESGCGKTSVLRAGIWPKLLREQQCCFYVQFNDQQPDESIRQAIIEQLSVEQVTQVNSSIDPRDSLKNIDLSTLLGAIASSEHRPIVLLLDQFEQFFIHHRRKAQRSSFLEDLARLYSAPPMVAVKMFFCLRSDFTDRIIELQDIIGFTLGPHQNFRLEKFTPAEASSIFQVIAEEENLELDEWFIKTLTEQDMASRDDGLISPTDVQIIAWMITSEKEQKDRVFDKHSYQKLGGLEGLMERFLDRALAARETQGRRDAAVKVLLALTDLERNARAGVLPINLLTDKLSQTLQETTISEAVGWLSRSDVRLITRVEREKVDGYQLANERLIPALRKVAGKSLSEVERANHLLERRINEWLGNDRASRYLLTWRELRSIERQLPYLSWGSQRLLGEKLLSKSKRRWRRRVILACLISLIIPTSIIGGFIWWNSSYGRIYRVTNQLLKLSESKSEAQDLERVATAFAYVNKFEISQQISNRIRERVDKVHALTEISQAAVIVGDANQAAIFLQQARQVMEAIDEPSRKVTALGDVAVATARIGDTKRARELLSQALRDLEEVKDNYPKGLALTKVAVAEANIAEISKSGDDMFLDRALSAANNIKTDDPNNAALATKDQSLEAIAGIATKYAYIDHNFSFLRRAFSIAGGIKDPETKERTIYDLASNISRRSSSSDELDVLKELFSSSDTSDEIKLIIIGGIARIGVVKKDLIELNRAEKAIEQINGFEYASLKSCILFSMARAAEDLGADKQKFTYLEKAESAMNEIQWLHHMAHAMMCVAVINIDAGDAKRAQETFEQTLAMATQDAVGQHDDKDKALSAISQTQAYYCVIFKDVDYLDQAIQTATKIQRPEIRGPAIESIVRASAFLGKLQVADELVRRTDGDDRKLESLCALLQSWGTRNNPNAHPYDDEVDLSFDVMLPSRVHRLPLTNVK